MKGTCEACGNTYERAFEVIDSDGDKHVFDCFECAINELAPSCTHCGNRIIGHGVEEGNAIYCCAHCARAAGAEGLVDSVEKSAAN